MALPGLYFRSQPAAQQCQPCPENCKTVSEPQTWYLHKNKLSESDKPIVIIKKRMVCSSGAAIPSCELELRKLQQQILSR